MTTAAERDQGVTEPRASETRRELEARLEEHRQAWTDWLRAIQILGAETDPVRAGEAAAEVMAKARRAVRARVEMLPLLRLEMRWRELEPGRYRFPVDGDGALRVPR